jgi:hypothetical protein
MKPLPATYLEHLAAYDAPLLKAARDNAAALRSTGQVATASVTDMIQSDKNYEALIARRIDALLAATSKKHRIPVPELRERMKQGEFDSNINALRIITTKMYLTAIRHFIAGERIYYCADGLADRLMHTDVKVPSELLRLPFSHIMLIFNAPEITERFARDRGVKATKARPICVTIAQDEHDGVPAWVIDISQTRGEKLIASDHRTLILHPGTTSAAIIRQDHAAAETHIPANDFAAIQEHIPSLRGPETPTAFDADQLWLYRLIVNLVLYITSAAPELGWNRKNGKQHTGDRVNFSPREHIVVGESISRIVRYSDPAARSTPEKGSGAVRPLAHQVIVAGHWKSQAYGPNREARKTIWIEPYERGPDVAQMVARPILVR